MAERLTNPALLKVQADFTRFIEFELEPHEKQWNCVVDNRHDARADLELAALRPRSAALYRTEKELTRQIAIEEEREKLANDLRPFHTQGAARGASIVETIQRSVELPSRELLTELAIISRDVESLRRAIYDVTGDTRYSKSVDFVDLVRFHWFQQNAARERALVNITSPGHRPRRTEPAPWEGAVTRLSELRSQEEIAHAR